MKTPSFFSSIRAAGILTVALTVMAAALSAQTPAPAKPASPQPQGDPFIKKEVGSTATEETESVCNVGATLEIYALSQADAAKLIGENSGGPVLHDRVLELVKKGNARLETVLSNVAKSGKQAFLQQTDELHYPTYLRDGDDANKLPIPTEYESRNTGDSFEWEPSLAPDNRTCDLSFVISEVHFSGFADLHVTKKKMAFGPPRFETREITNKQTVRVGAMQFLGTLSAAPDFKTADAPDAEADKSHSLQVRLLFGRVDVVRIPRKPLPQEDQEGNLEEQLSFYSLDRETARTVLGEIASPGAVFAALQPHLDRHEAKLERLLVLKTQSGQQGITQETDEIRYDAGEAEGIATRNTGLVLEIEPVRAANASIVDIDMVPQMVKLNGDLHFDGIAEKYQSQPVFETRKVTTSLSAALGEQAFIGTFSQPTDTGVNGQKDTGRVWLGFIRVNLVKP